MAGTKKAPPKKKAGKKEKEGKILRREGDPQRLRRLLTEKEKLQRLDVFQRAAYEAQELMVQKKNAVTKMDDEIKRKQAVANEAMAEIRFGTFEDVKVEERLNFKTGLIRVYRKDTGEFISERKMNESDRQERLPIDDPGRRDEEKKAEPEAKGTEEAPKVGPGTPFALEELSGEEEEK